MNIAIVAPYCSLPNEPHFNRFWYLAERLAQQHQVTLFTSSFRHYDKTFRKPEDAQNASQGRLKVVLLKESGYQRNVSLARVTSHHQLVRDFSNHLKHAQKGEWDVVYSAYPLIATNILLGKHKARLGYKLIIDVQDVWPESFSSVVPILKKIPHHLLPFAHKANTAYGAADALTAVSQTYLNRALEANPNALSEVVYIGADYDSLEQTPAKVLPQGKTRFFYLGTLSYSYDMTTVCEGIKQMADAGEAVELHVLGGGPDLDKLRSYEGNAIKFYGFVPYSEMIAIAKGCDIAVNPIHSYAMQSITNKLSDYMALQKPIMNSQIGEETAEVLSLLPHENYQSGNVDSFINAARNIMNKKQSSIHSEEIINRFKRSKSYERLVNLISRVANI